MARRLAPLPLLAAGCAVVAAAALLPGVARAGTPLVASVGPGYQISLTDASGRLVEHLDAGSYTITVHDYAEHHNLHLYGPGVDRKTGIEELAEETWEVTLRDGPYTVICDPHGGAMQQDFAVGSYVFPPPRTVTPVATTSTAAKATVPAKTTTATKTTAAKAAAAKTPARKPGSPPAVTRR